MEREEREDRYAQEIRVEREETTDGEDGGRGKGGRRWWGALPEHTITNSVFKARERHP